MAKKSKKKKGLSLQSLVLLIVGAGLFGLAFLPAIKSSVTLPIVGESISTTNFYQIIKSGFSEGASTEILIMAIASLANLILAGSMVVVGVLGLLGIVKTNKFGIILYLASILMLIAIMICFFIAKKPESDALSQFVQNLTNAKYSTFVYFPLGLSVLGLVGHFVTRKK